MIAAYLMEVGSAAAVGLLVLVLTRNSPEVLTVLSEVADRLGVALMQHAKLLLVQ